MKSTKKNIIDKTIELFNSKGFNNVTMKVISDELNISPGNLTYHFPKKEKLIFEIFREMQEERMNSALSIKEMGGVENLHNLLQPLMEIYYKYRFFYTDTLEVVRLYPKIAKLNQDHLSLQINEVKHIINYSVENGDLKPEQILGQYNDLAHTCWMIFTFWLQQRIILGTTEGYNDQARFAIWNLIYPLLTEKGLHNFRKVRHEQEEYMKIKLNLIN